jgi:hypothetical protein
MSFVELWNTSDAKKLQINVEKASSIHFNGSETVVEFSVGQSEVFEGEYAPLYGFRHLLDRAVRLILRKKN